jgi:predicted MPP superfamily phosphohydrolase
MFRALTMPTATVAAVAVWALLVEPRRLVVRRRTIEIEGWPEAPLTIACLADLHAGAPQTQDRRVKRIVRRTAALDADLIALLGDFVDPLHHFVTRVPPHVVAARLGRLRAPLGVLAVLGNHDWLGEGDFMPRALRAAGIRVLEDEALELRPGLWLAGLGDLRTRGANLQRALADVPPEAALLVLSHDPDAFVGMPDRPALMLSGHTHGGQINLPWLRRKVAPTAGGFVEGEHRRGRAALYVTSGVGTSGWPVRFLKPPELVLLTVTGSGRRGSS